MSPNAVLTVEEMRAAEQAAIDSGVSEWDLMQRAGLGAAEWVLRMAGGRPVTVLCGPGNNGGDGYVIAEYLRKADLPVSIVAPKAPGTDTARTAREHCSVDISQSGLSKADIYVDCLFGYGLAREIEGDFAALLQGLNEANGYKIAIDIPSSIASDTGRQLGPEVHYDLTLALGAWKRAHFTMPVMAGMGANRIVDIGLDLAGSAARLSEQPRISAPAIDAHKYKRGLLAIVAGEMPGAPLLAAEAAMRSGAGYVKLFSEHSHPDATAELVIEQGALDIALNDERLSSVLIGPGLGRGDSARKRLALALSSNRPIVLDADALHLLNPTMLEHSDPKLIAVTPHEGELAKLCEAFGIKGENKIDRATALHDQTGVTVLAKGPDSVLAGAEGLRFFERGSSWLSVAGTGDVLAGIAASRLAVHGEVQLALEEAVWIHHEAAALAGLAFTAGDLASSVNRALERFL